jgi:hypothetical protein
MILHSSEVNDDEAGSSISQGQLKRNRRCHPKLIHATYNLYLLLQLHGPPMTDTLLLRPMTTVMAAGAQGTRKTYSLPNLIILNRLRTPN